MVMRMMTLTVMAISVFFLGHSGKHCSGKNKVNEAQMSWLFFLSFSNLTKVYKYQDIYPDWEIIEICT